MVYGYRIGKERIAELASHNVLSRILLCSKGHIEAQFSAQTYTILMESHLFKIGLKTDIRFGNEEISFS